MVGRDLAIVEPVAPSPERPIILSVRGLTREPPYSDVRFEIRKGESSPWTDSSGRAVSDGPRHIRSPGPRPGEVPRTAPFR